MGSKSSRIVACRRFGMALLVAILHATFVPLGQSQVENCFTEASAVFNQALSTHRTVLFEVLAGKRRGRWQPDGTFRDAFLSRNARALRDIRNLLSRDDWEETALLESFHRLLNTRLPQGVYLPKSVRATETAKFHKRVRRYVSCRNKSN